MTDENLQIDDVTDMGELVGHLRESARAEFTVWLQTLDTADATREPGTMMAKITAESFATFIVELGNRLARSIASLPTNVSADHQDASHTLDHVRKALEGAGVGVPPRGDEPGLVAAMGVRLRELGAQVLRLSTRTSEIKSGDELNWPEVRRAAKRIGEIASNQVFIAPEMVDVHASRCDEVIREIDSIAGHLKLSRPSL